MVGIFRTCRKPRSWPRQVLGPSRGAKFHRNRSPLRLLCAIRCANSAVAPKWRRLTILGDCLHATISQLHGRCCGHFVLLPARSKRDRNDGRDGIRHSAGPRPNQRGRAGGSGLPPPLLHQPPRMFRGSEPPANGVPPHPWNQPPRLLLVEKRAVPVSGDGAFVFAERAVTIRRRAAVRRAVP